MSYLKLFLLAVTVFALCLQPAIAQTTSGESTGGWGLRGSLGFAGGLNDTWFGKRATGNGSEYLESVGGGLAYTFEGLYDFNNNIGLGLGIYSPLGWDLSKSTTYTSAAGWTSKDDSTSKFSSLPIGFTVYMKQPVMTNVNLLMGWGWAMCMGGDITGKTTVTNTWTGGSSTSVTDSTNTVNGCFASRGALGAEYALDKNWSLFGMLNVISGNFNMTKSVEKRVNTSNGVITSTSETTEEYDGDGGTLLAAPTTTWSPAVAPTDGTQVEVYDNGITTTTTTTTYVGGVDVRTDTVSKTKKAAGRAQTIGQLSFLAGVSFHF